MAGKIVVLIGLFAIALAVGCGGEGETKTNDFPTTDPDIQTARMKIAELKDAYKDALEDLGREAQEYMNVGGLEDDERDQRQAEMAKKGREKGRALVDGVRAALDAVPETARKANVIDYLGLTFATPVFSTPRLDQRGQIQKDPQTGEEMWDHTRLIAMDSNVYGLTPERSKWYTDKVVDLMEPGMDDTAKRFIGRSAIMLLMQFGDARQNLDMIEQVIAKDPKGDFWPSIGAQRETWTTLKISILHMLGEYEKAETLARDVEVSLKDEMLKSLQESIEKMQEDRRKAEREEKDREADKEKTAEDKVLPRATIVFVSEDGLSEKKVEVILLEDDNFNGVANFIHLVETEKYYDNKEIFASIQLAILGGGKFDTGIGEPDYTIETKCERGILRGTLAYLEGDAGRILIFKHHADKEDLQQSLRIDPIPFGYIVGENIDVIDTLGVGARIKEITITVKRKDSVYEPVKKKEEKMPQYGGQDMMPMMPSGR